MMKVFQPMPLSEWRATRDTVAGYARFVRGIRRENTPPQKHWWHVSLRTTVTGLSTTPIRATSSTIYELEFDFTEHALHITTSEGVRRCIPLHGQAVSAFRDEVLETLLALGVSVNCDKGQYNDATPGTYDRNAVFTFWQNLIQIDNVLKEFSHNFIEETSPVQFWPHHFDLAVVWFSGRKVPGQDPSNPEWANEQMNFGFSTGDDSIPEPYFYATAYPEPAGWKESVLPAGAFWRSAGWSGAALPYQRLVEAEDGRSLLLDFLNTTQRAGAELMQERALAENGR
jgi:hypothetical protein